MKKDRKKKERDDLNDQNFPTCAPLDLCRFGRKIAQIINHIATDHRDEETRHQDQ